MTNTTPLKALALGAAIVIPLGLLGACQGDGKIAKAYDTAHKAAEVVRGAVCALPDNDPIRLKIRDGFGQIGVDSSRVCAEGFTAFGLGG